MTSCSLDACDARGAAQELAVARVAEQQGDIPHAAFHVAAALFEDLLSLEAKTMALRLDDAQPGVFRPEGFAGAVAAAVVVAFARGRVEQAINWTAQLAEGLPDLPWDVWLSEQIGRAVATNTPVPTARLAQTALLLGKGSIGLLHLQPGEQRAFARYADAFFGATAAVNVDGMLCAAISALCRRAGQYERALALAQRAQQLSPTEGTPLIMQGLALRALGQTDNAVEAFRRAGTFDTDTLSYAADRARCLVDAQRFQEALDLLESIENKDEDIEIRMLRAFAVARGARLPRHKVGLLQRLFKSSGAADVDAVEAQLRTYANTLSFVGDVVDSDTVRHLAMGHWQWWGVSEATVNVLQQVPRTTSPSTLQLTLSAMEAPSSQLCLALHTGHTDARALAVSVSRVPEPDPRSVDDDGYAVWAFDGTTPFPAVPAPPAAVRAAVESVFAGETRMWWPTWRKRAEAHSHLDVEQVAACMVHPSMPESARDVVWHVAHTQLAAAAVLSTTEAGRALLLRLVGGPVDWVTVAAVTALGEACAEGTIDPGVVGRRLRRLVDERVHDAACCLNEPLQWLLLRVPFMRHETVAKLVRDDDNGAEGDEDTAS